MTQAAAPRLTAAKSTRLKRFVGWGGITRLGGANHPQKKHHKAIHRIPARLKNGKKPAATGRAAAGRAAPCAAAGADHSARAANDKFARPIIVHRLPGIHRHSSTRRARY